MTNTNKETESDEINDAMMAALAPELAELISYMAEVAVIIRYRAIYPDPREGSKGLMEIEWFSDSIHNFDYIRQGIIKKSRNTTISKCESLLRDMECIKNNRKFEFSKPDINLEDAKRILKNILNIVSNNKQEEH